MRVHKKSGFIILNIIFLFVLFASCTRNSDSNSKIISEKDSMSQKADSLYTNVIKKVKAN